MNALHQNAIGALRAAAVALTLIASVAAPCVAMAQQAFPSRQIRIVVPFSPGGPTDIAARLVAPGMSTALGQPVVVQNMPGANANLGATNVKNSAADGHTILASTWGNVIQPLVSKAANFSLQTDFAPVTLIYTSQYLMLAPVGVPVADVGQINAYAKANPGKLSFGSPGDRGVIHVALEYWKKQAGIDINHVPYKGEADVVKALLSGEVQLGVVSVLNAGPLLKGGKVKPIATPSPARLPAYPDVPTFAEAGIKDIEIWNYNGLHVPAGTPQATITAIHASVQAALKDTSVTTRIRDMGGVVVGSTPAEYGKFIDGEVRKWQAMVRTIGIKTE